LTDTRGKGTARDRAVSHFDEDKFTSGHAFDGSSIAGWKGIEASDMLLMPDPNTARMDPFFEEPTLILSCDVLEPGDGKAYDRDPRSIAKRAEAYLKASGLGDTAYFGPEPEFFIFDGVTLERRHVRLLRQDQSDEAPWSSGQEDGRRQHGPPSDRQGRLLPGAAGRQRCRTCAPRCACPRIARHPGRSAPPRSGQRRPVRARHQVQHAGPARRLDDPDAEVRDPQRGHAYGKTATFMPKPVVGDNGSGMHVHQSVWKDGKNLFAGDGYAGLSEFALYYIGGIIKHARALNAITNPGTNSYKRLVPGFEAPVKLAYSRQATARPRSASRSCNPRAVASKRASRIRRATRTSASRRC
jgi:glutamine synthetase